MGYPMSSLSKSTPAQIITIKITAHVMVMSQSFFVKDIVFLHFLTFGQEKSFVLALPSAGASEEAIALMGQGQGIVSYRVMSGRKVTRV